MKSSAKHVFIVDDEPEVRDSLSKFFKLHQFKVSVYADAITYLNNLNQDDVGCLISDIDIDEMNGLELQKRLNELKCIRPTIFITGHSDISIAVEAMKLGAMDFIEKPFDPDILLIKATLAIELFTDKILIINRYRLLTNKEIQVFNCVINGEKNRIIADKLFISLPTVEAHRSRVMKKMQAESVADLVRFSMLTNLVA